MQLARLLRERGHGVVHTHELPDGNRTTDAELIRNCRENDRIMVSKDDDLRMAQRIRGHPRVVLLVRTGNIANADLLRLFESRYAELIGALETATLVEVHRTMLVIESND
jgi:predicted nuclease of predicted toxin-antitoxin system